MVRIKKEISSELQSPQSLENSIARVEQLLVAARRVATEMERLQTGPILIAYQPSFECALTDLARWGKACEDALTIKLKEGGYFRAAGEAARPTTRPAAKPAARPAARPAAKKARKK